jgi:hypothetical protein
MVESNEEDQRPQINYMFVKTLEGPGVSQSPHLRLSKTPMDRRLDMRDVSQGYCSSVKQDKVEQVSKFDRRWDRTQ